MDTESPCIDPTTQLEIINQLCERLNACYIFPEAAEHICHHLQQTLVDGEYDGLTDGNLFALALTIQLQEVTHDEHLWVRWHEQPLPDGEPALRNALDWQEQQKAAARSENYGFHKLEKLSGNIGYLDLHYLHKPAWAGDAIVEAMNLLSDSAALILDLRQCKGGYPGSVALLCSYFFGEESVLLTSIYWRDEDLTQQYWTLPYVPGKHLDKQPLYVLTSKTTFSAGELLASTLQLHRRAVVIGEQTDGGANPGASYRIHPHFEAFIPIGRTIDPLTGSNLESFGVTPDITAPPEKSFDLAYQMAEQTLLKGINKDGYLQPSNKDIKKLCMD
jgi:C-terminal processing protease CtpA/Prc